MATATSTLTLVLNARNNTKHAFQQVQHEAGGLHERLKHMGESLKDFVGVGAAVGAFSALAEGVHELPAAFIEAANAGQQFTTQMQNFYGSQDNANKILDYGNQFAIKYGLSIDSTRTAIANLASTGQDVSKLLPAGANIAAALHSSLPDFTSAFNKAFTTGADRGLRAYLHMSRAQLQAAGVEYDKHGKVIASSLAPALERLAQTRFGDAAARQAQTMGGQIQSLKGIWETFKETAGNALIKGVQGPLGQVVGWLKNHQALVQQFATTVGSLMGKVAQAVVHFGLAAWPVVVKAFATVKAAWPGLHTVWQGMQGAVHIVVRTIGELVGAITKLIPHFHHAHKSAHDMTGVLRTLGFVIGLVVTALVGLRIINNIIGMVRTATTVIKGAREAMAAFNIVLGLNPIGLVVLAIAGLVLAFVYAYNHVKGFHDLVNRVWQFLQGVFGPILGTLGGILKGAFAAAWDAAKKAADSVWHAVRVVWQLFKDNVLPILKHVGDILKGAFSSAWQNAHDKVTTVFDLLKKFWNWLNSTLHLEKIGQGIKDALGGAFDFVKDKIDNFVKGFEGLLKGLEHLPGMGWIKGALEALGKAKKEVATQDTHAHAKSVAGMAHVTHTVTHRIHGTAGETHDGALPRLLHPAATGSGASTTSAADAAKHFASDFGTAMTLFRASGGLDPADVKRMQADIAQLRKTDPDKAAKMQAQLDAAQANRRDAIARHNQAAQHHAQVAAHHAQVQAQRAQHHAQAQAHRQQAAAHRAALRNTNADTSTVLRRIHEEIRTGHYAQAGRDIARYQQLVVHGDRLRGLDPARAKADADARVHTLTDELHKAQHRATAVHVAAYKQAGFDLTAGVGYGSTQVGMGPLRDALVEHLRQQIAQQMAQIKELQAQNQHLVAIEHNTRGTHEETKKVVGHTKPAARGGAHGFAQRHGVPFPV